MTVRRSSLLIFGNSRLRSEYGSDIHSFEKDKDKDLKQLKSVLSWLRSLDEAKEAQFLEEKEHTQECASANRSSPFGE